MKKTFILKKSIAMILVAWIIFMSVFTAYERSTQCAELAEGIIALIGGGPILTALMFGGVLVAGGIALDKLSQTTPEDYRQFEQGIKNGFNSFVAEQEKQIALEKDQSLSDHEAADIGVAAARDKVNSFFSNAIQTTKNTVNNIKLDVQKYWNQYCSSINEVCTYEDNVDTVPDPSDSIPIPSYNANEKPEVNTNKTTTGAEIFEEFEGNYYITQASIWGESTIDYGYRSNGAYFEIPFGVLQSNNYLGIYVCQIHVPTHNVTIQTTSQYTNWGSSIALNQCLIPTFSINTEDINSLMDSIRSDYVGLLAIVAGSTVLRPWEAEIKNTLDNTHFGNAIQTGRKQLVNEGDWIGSIFKNDAVPVQKSGVTVAEGVVSAPLGWSIPSGATWDDVFSGGKPYADVVGQTGAIGVPDDVITGTKSDDRVIEYPDTADVQDTSDYPREGADDPTIDDSKPQEIPEKPQSEVFDDQGGSFYPNAMDLTNIFPFCIPFDIIYLVEKFDVHGDRAPVIEIPIVYPEIMQSTLGESYTVVIDFEDFIVVRNIIRVFLLILFIVGLLKITRDLIRG